MWNIIKEYRHYVATVFLAILPILALNAGGKSPTNWNWLDRAVVYISSPVQSAISWGIHGAWNGLEHYLFLLNTQHLNESLSEENRNLLSEIANLKETSLENERLKKLIDFSAPLPGKKIVAPVIAQDVSSEFRLIRLGKGREHGIQTGMAVITPEGIVGRVLRVSAKYTDVLTLLDSSSAIDAIVQRSRSRGILEGLTESLLSMKYVRRTDDVQIGDLVISSGIGGIFPKGLTVGKVSNVKKKDYGISQIVEVTPSVDFDNIEEVTVINSPDIPLGEILESEQPPPPTATPTKEQNKGAPAQ